MLETPKRDRRSERREATKAEILEVAWDICRAEGLAALSLREVAGRVGMQAPSLYSYFASKNDIYDAMFAQGFQQMAKERPPHPTGVPRREAVLASAEFFVRFCTSDPVRYQLLFQRTIPGFEPSPESYGTSVDEYEKFVEFFASLGIEGKDVMDMYTALFTGITDQQISNDPGGDRWLRLVDDAVDMLLAYVDKKKRKKATK